jgi:hypothetical protein
MQCLLKTWPVSRNTNEHLAPRALEIGFATDAAQRRLRKAAATHLADAGCTDHEIMAWGGWETLKEVQRSTRAANRKRLAQSGREKLETRTLCGKPE